ncbi:uncharacterized protein [Hyperolius riggenbachi]|uniref:uncharacterized protein n=1 Tax=Hyperolius riggenbachi TaxID=752182 RepID=UPI0035A2AA7F
MMTGPGPSQGQGPPRRRGKKRSRRGPAVSSQATTGKQRAKKRRRRGPKPWLPDLRLTMEDKMDLQGTGMLRCAVLEAAVKLLRQQFQDATGLPCIRAVCFPVRPRTVPTVQFHVDCQHQHGFVTACEGTKVVVADSYKAMAFGSMAIRQIKDSYKNYMKDPTKNMEYLAVDQQSSTNKDCVIHCIANAYELLAADGNPECVYNKQLMRPHLLQCFTNRKITEFPKDYKPAGQPSVKPFKWKP